MNNAEEGFYKAFEDKFRGDREVIKSRLEVYLPFVNKLKETQSEAKALDLGCGRGEWLELLRDNNVVAQGVDLDEGMLTDCQALGLQVETADALEVLKKTNNESLSVISAFHVVEHISFDNLQILIKESLRVLRPGGLLILETPNPENITVATTSFYLDPTHEKPIPPLLLWFLSEHQGFHRSKILRLQESKAYENSKYPALTQVIEGVSPDYSIIAQKKADAETLIQFDSFFSKDYGCSLNALSTLYDEFINNKINCFENEILKANKNAEEASRMANEASKEAIEANRVASEANKVARQSEQELRSIYNSRSWRITFPLRWIGFQIRLVRDEGVKNRLKALFKKILSVVLNKIAIFINERPNLRYKVRKIASKLGLENKIKEIFNISYVVPSSSAKENLPVSYDQLSSGGKSVFLEIKSLIDKKEA